MLILSSSPTFFNYFFSFHIWSHVKAGSKYLNCFNVFVFYFSFSAQDPGRLACMRKISYALKTRITCFRTYFFSGLLPSEGHSASKSIFKSPVYVPLLVILVILFSCCPTSKTKRRVTYSARSLRQNCVVMRKQPKRKQHSRNLSKMSSSQYRNCRTSFISIYFRCISTYLLVSL